MNCYSQVKKGGFSTVFSHNSLENWPCFNPLRPSPGMDWPRTEELHGLWERKSARQVTCVFLKLVDLVDGLEHEFYYITCLIFPYIGNNDPNWLSYFSYDFPFSWEFHDPNWRTHIFQRVGKNHQPDGTVPRCLALSKHLKVLRHELCACGACESVTARWIATSKKAALMGIPSDRKPSRIWVNQWIHQFQGYSYNVWHGNGMFGNYVNYNLQVYVNLSTWEWINTYLYHF